MGSHPGEEESLTLARMIARAACIMGEPMTVLYRELSFPELAFILSEHDREMAAASLTLVSGLSLGGASLWSKDAGKAYQKFLTQLSEFAHGPAKKKKTDLGQELSSLFSQLGIAKGN